jgi:hypothetical protein
VSCSNCTDYQARRLGIGYGQKKVGYCLKWILLDDNTLIYLPNVDQSLISCHHLCLYKSQNDKQSKQFVHMLNSTLTATERTLCCILENYQKEDGVEVPKVLQPYMDGIDFLPFKRPLGSKQASDAKPNKSKPKVCLSLWFSSFPRQHVKSTIWALFRPLLAGKCSLSCKRRELKLICIREIMMRPFINLRGVVCSMIVMLRFGLLIPETVRLWFSCVTVVPHHRETDSCTVHASAHAPATFSSSLYSTVSPIC